MRVPLEHGRGDALDCAAVGDVADLVLAAELLGERAQPILAAREQDAVEPASREGTRDRGADPARGAGDDRYLQSRTVSFALACAPEAAVTTATSVCFPRWALRACQSAT